MHRQLHPHIQRLISEGFIAQPDTEMFTVEKVRSGNIRITEQLVGPGDPVERWWNADLETKYGWVGLRWYIPSQIQVPVLLIYVHGGGWVSGSIASYDTLCRSIAVRIGAPLVSVEYEKSPEVRWPKALMQVADVVSRAEVLARDAAIRIEKIAVIGDSAGGALLCGALHHLAEAMQEIPSAAVLLYPVLDASLEYESYARFATGFHLTTARVRWYWEQYVGIPFEEIQRRSWDPYLSPMRSKQLHKFPPTMLISAECDPLRDEGEVFVQLLKHHGVRAEYLDVPGHIHGFMRFRKVLDDPNWGPDAIVERMRQFLVSAFSRG